MKTEITVKPVGIPTMVVRFIMAIIALLFHALKRVLYYALVGLENFLGAMEAVSDTEVEAANEYKGAESDDHSSYFVFDYTYGPSPVSPSGELE